MPILLKNITCSVVNVPHNKKTKPKYTLHPGEVVELDDTYLLGLNEEAQNRFLRVTQGKDAVFEISDLDKSKKAKRKSE